MTWSLSYRSFASFLRDPLSFCDTRIKFVLPTGELRERERMTVVFARYERCGSGGPCVFLVVPRPEAPPPARRRRCCWRACMGESGSTFKFLGRSLYFAQRYQRSKPNHPLHTHHVRTLPIHKSAQRRSSLEDSLPPVKISEAPT